MEHFDHKALRVRVRNLIATDRFDQAQQELRQWAEAPPDSSDVSENKPDLWCDLADQARQTGEVEVVRRAVNRAVACGLEPTVGQIRIGETQMVAGEFAQALETFSPLVKEQPQNAILASWQALAQFETDDKHTALENWEASRSFSGQNLCPLPATPFHLALGAMAFERSLSEQRIIKHENYEGSDSPLQRAKGLMQSTRIRQMERSLEAHEFDQVLNWVAAEKPTKRSEESLKLLRIFALAESGYLDQARAELVEILDEKSSEKNPLLLAFYGLYLVRSEQPQYALKVLKTVQAEGPDDYFVNYFRGTAYLALDDRPRALAAYSFAFQHFFFDTFNFIFLPVWQQIKSGHVATSV